MTVPQAPRPPPDRDAVIFALSRRGFFSEINVLVLNVAYALAAGEDLFLDDSAFLVDWDDLLEPTLRSGSQLRKRRYRRVTPSSLRGDRTAWFQRLHWVKRDCDAGLHVSVPSIGFEGTWRDLLFQVSKQVFIPKPEIVALADQAQAELGLQSRFAAIHVRRGDKVAGDRLANGDLRVEGEVVPVAAYVRELSARAPDIRRVFVLSDDYREAVQAQAQFPDLQFVTLCTPEEEGYFQQSFLAMSHEGKVRSLRRLMAEVLIATRSAVFVGAYRSNVSLTIAALHSRPDDCVSVDRAVAWTPMV